MKKSIILIPALITSLVISAQQRGNTNLNVNDIAYNNIQGFNNKVVLDNNFDNVSRQNSRDNEERNNVNRNGIIAPVQVQSNPMANYQSNTTPLVNNQRGNGSISRNYIAEDNRNGIPEQTNAPQEQNVYVYSLDNNVGNEVPEEQLNMRGNVNPVNMISNEDPIETTEVQEYEQTARNVVSNVSEPIFQMAVSTNKEVSNGGTKMNFNLDLPKIDLNIGNSEKESKTTVKVAEVEKKVSSTSSKTQKTKSSSIKGDYHYVQHTGKGTKKVKKSKFKKSKKTPKCSVVCFTF